MNKNRYEAVDGIEATYAQAVGYTRAGEVSMSGSDSRIQAQQNKRASSEKEDEIHLQGFKIHGSLKGKNIGNLSNVLAVQLEAKAIELKKRMIRYTRLVRSDMST